MVAFTRSRWGLQESDGRLLRLEALIGKECTVLDATRCFTNTKHFSSFVLVWRCAGDSNMRRDLRLDRSTKI